MKLYSFFQPPFHRFRWMLYLLCLLGFVYVPSGLVQTFRLNGMAEAWFAQQAMQGVADGFSAFHALLLWPLKAWLPPYEQALLLGLVLPLLFLAVLFVVAPHMPAGLVAERRRGFAVLFVVFMPALFALFSPGSVGPQAYSALAFALFVACLLRPVRDRREQLVWFLAALLFFAVHRFLMPWTELFDVVPAHRLDFLFRNAFLPMVGTVASLALGLGTRGQRRWRFWVLFVIQLAMAAQAVGSTHALALWQLACVPSVLALFFVLWDRLPCLGQGAWRYGAEAALVLGLTVFPVALVPAALDGGRWVPDVLLAPMVRSMPACQLRGAAYELAILDHPVRILNQVDLGPELLLRAPAHKTLVPDPFSPYLSESVAFFDAKTDVAALDIVRKLDVDYVFACPEATKIAEGGLMQRLARNQTPPWLMPMGLVFDGKTLLYKVKKEKR